MKASGNRAAKSGFAKEAHEKVTTNLKFKSIF
jgi:hypothetical protein